MKHVIESLRKADIQVIDRRGKALGGNPRQRRLSAITKGAQHWTASNRQGDLSAIEGHEAWWRSIPQTMGDMGGYHIFIPRSGTAIINYDFETQTPGVRRHNGYTVHVSYEGNPANPMTESQRRTLKVIWNAIPKDVPGIKSMDDVLGHNEFPGHASNQCPGINMNNFRSFLKNNREVEVAVSGPAPQPAVQSSSTPQPAPRPQPQVPQLKIDGSFGPATTRRLQQVLGTPVVGVISGQQRTSITENIPSVQFGSGGSMVGGSMVVREMQRRLGLPQNQQGGLFGPLTLKALQRRMGTPVTGAISRTNSAVVKELQRRLNHNRF